MTPIVGRDAEWSVIDAFLDRAGSGPNALVLEGSAGIGKSTLWLAGVEAARERGFAVLASRPAETERLLANVVLGDLLRAVGPEDLATLAGPRRRAFEAALLISDDPQPSPDLRALGVAIVDLLPLLARGAPLLVAVDDDQWMDPSSAATLAFALRRIGGRGGSLLLARRAGEVPPAALEDAFAADAVEQLAVRPLSVGALQVLVRERLGVVLSRPMQVWLHEITGGNAFHALEVARTLPSTAGRPEMSRAPGGLDRLLDARLGTLDEPALDALLLVAAHGRMPTAMLRDAAIPAQAVDAARDAGVIDIVDGVARFTHPLLASSIYQGATDEQRRAAHQRLAGVADDPIHRARHLALGAEGPDRELAKALESSARLAADRGVSIAAAELADHALRLTPVELVGDRRRRGAAAARAHSAAGDGTRGRATAADLLAMSEPGRERAEALLLASEFEPAEVAVTLLQQALAEAGGAPDVQAAAHTALSESLHFAFIDRPAAAGHATAALRLANELRDDRLRADALSNLAVVRLGSEDVDVLDFAETAYRLASEVGDLALLQRVGRRLAHVLAWVGDADRARAWLEERLADWAERDEWARLSIVWYLALVELWSGRWDLAGEYVDEAIRIASDYGMQTPPDFYPAALLALHRGDLDAARELSGRGLAVSAAGQLMDNYAGILATCDLWSGDPDAAIAGFGRAEEEADALGVREPSMREWRREYVEALLQLRRVDEARSLVDGWEEAARRLDRGRIVAQAVYCRGLVAAARGDGAAAIEVLDEAVALHHRVGDPYGLARARLALGINRRRARQKATARDALEAALAGFEALGATYWAAAARAELARVGGRGRVTGLSAAELSVATLAAEGRTNREIAATLFLADRTVASHLTHVYAKLGVRSRTELARHLGTAGDAGHAGAGATSTHSTATTAGKVQTS